MCILPQFKEPPKIGAATAPKKQEKPNIARQDVELRSRSPLEILCCFRTVHTILYSSHIFSYYPSNRSRFRYSIMMSHTSTFWTQRAPSFLVKLSRPSVISDLLDAGIVGHTNVLLPRRHGWGLVPDHGNHPWFENEKMVSNPSLMKDCHDFQWICWCFEILRNLICPIKVALRWLFWCRKFPHV